MARPYPRETKHVGAGKIRFVFLEEYVMNDEVNITVYNYKEIIKIGDE